MRSIPFLFEALILNIALSIDSLMSGFAYGTNKIKIPKISLLIISVISSLILGLSIGFASIIAKYIDTNISLLICVFILIFLGIFKIMDGLVKQIIKTRKGIDKNLEFSIFSIKMTLNLYASPELSDFDNSKTLSFKEAIAIAIALSLDSFTIGFGTGLDNLNFLKILIITLISFIFGIISLSIGRYLGNKFSSKIDINLSWISGVILIFIAISKLF